MKDRIISALVLIPMALFLTIHSNITFTFLVIVTLCIGLHELFNMCKQEHLFKMIGIMYLLLGSLSLMHIRNIDLIYIAYLFGVVWSCDTFAYFLGIKFGKTKLAPAISPKKSWEGAIAGVSFATIIGTFILTKSSIDIPVFFMLIISFLCSVTAVLGDLLESGLKRYMDVKDSGNIIPGHGGVLDRIDGLLPVSIVFFILLLFFVI